MRPLTQLQALRVMALLLCAACGHPTSSGGNVLIILLDDVGIDQIGVYKAHPNPPQTPVIDQLAADGMRFENAWALPVCSPARAALLTGRSPARTGIGTVIDHNDPARQRLRLSEQTVAELLRDEAGYGTAAFGKWHLVSPRRIGARRHPNRQGFDHFSGTLGPTSTAETIGKAGYRNWEHIVDGKLEISTEYEPEVIVREAIDAMEQLEPPWVVYVALNLPHTPLHRPPAELIHEPLGKAPTDLEKYRAMVEAADTLIGQLLAGIPDSERADTTVFLTADNGTPQHGLAPPLEGNVGKDTLHEGGLRVPLIVVGPDVAELGSTSLALVTLMDILPTAADIAGIRSSRELDGRSLMPLFADPTGPGHPLLFAHAFSPAGAGPIRRESERRAVRSATHKWTEGTDQRSLLVRLNPTGLEEDPVAPLHRTADDMIQEARLRAALGRQPR